MELLEPLLAPVVLLFAAMAAAIGVPLALWDPERRLRRIGFLALLVGGFFLLHGELRSAPAVRAGFLGLTGTLAAVLFALSLQRYMLRRALLAERPRSPDEWTLGDGRRLWMGKLRAESPLRHEDGRACLFLRTEIDRWDAGRWRRIAANEFCAEALELAGRSKRMAVQVPRSILRRGACELEPYRACKDGWRHDPDPDPACLYRVRTLAVLDGTLARILGSVQRHESSGLILRGAAGEAFQFEREPVPRLGRQAGWLAAGALLCVLIGIWGAWS